MGTKIRRIKTYTPATATAAVTGESKQMEMEAYTLQLNKETKKRSIANVNGSHMNEPLSFGWERYAAWQQTKCILQIEIERYVYVKRTFEKCWIGHRFKLKCTLHFQCDWTRQDHVPFTLCLSYTSLSGRL